MMRRKRGCLYCGSGHITMVQWTRAQFVAVFANPSSAGAVPVKTPSSGFSLPSASAGLATVLARFGANKEQRPPQLHFPKRAVVFFGKRLGFLKVLLRFLRVDRRGLRLQMRGEG